MNTDVNTVIFTSSLSRHQANFEIGSRSLFRHCVPVKPAYVPSSIPLTHYTVQPCAVYRLYVKHLHRRLVSHKRAKFRVNQRCRAAVYGKRLYRTVHVWYGHDVLNRSYGGTVFPIVPNRPRKPDSYVKTLKPVIYSWNGVLLA